MLALEIIAVEYTDGKEKKTGRGWTILKLFSSDDVIDVSTGRDAKSTRYLLTKEAVVRYL